MTERIYLDNITTSRVSDGAIKAMMPYFESAYGAASSPHQMGQELHAALGKSYRAVYDICSAKEEDVFVFTSSSCEAITQVMQSVYRNVTKKTGKNHFVASAIDEAASILAITKLEEEACMLRLAEVTAQGIVNQNTIAESITPRTALVSLSWACALTGVVQPIAEIAKICKARGILLHVDATHVIGKLSLDLQESRPDYITFNGEQFHAPKGIGGVFAKKPAPLEPLIYGEDEELRLRGGPLNVPFLIALGQASVEAKQNQNLYCTEVARLRDRFERNLQEHYPEAIAFFQNEERLPHVSCMAFPGIRNETLMYALNRKGVFANMGGGPFQQIELVLTASGVEAPLAKCALSFSFSKDTTLQDMEKACEIIVGCAKSLRRASKTLV